MPVCKVTPEVGQRHLRLRVSAPLTEQRVVVRPGNQLAAAQHPPGGSNHGADHCGAR
jgi:hypothetical protein